jgi:two-component sensor histidine kinase
MSVTENRFVKYALIILGGTIFSAYLFYSINDKYIVRNKSLIDGAKAKVQVKLIKELDRISLAMESMESLIKNSDTIPYPVFSELTEPFLNKLSGLILLGWGPELHFGETEGAMLNCNVVQDSICQQGQALLSFIRTDGKIEPKDGNPDRINSIPAEVKNGAGENLNKVIADAVSSRKAVISRSFPLTDDSKGRKAFFSMIPVFDSDDTSIKGISFGLFDMEELIRATLVYELPILDIEIRDLSNAEASQTTADSENMGSLLVDTLQLSSGGKGWDVIVNPKASLKKYPHSAESYFVLFLGLFSSILAAFVVKQRDEYSMRLSQEVQERTKELEDSNKLKETLLREIHHRVKNNLQIASSLMNLQKRKLTDPHMIDAFTSSQGRISAIALIHEEIYQHRDTKAVDFKNYLKDLIRYHGKISPSVSYEIDCPDITLDLDTAVPVALITSELLVNALKHAFPFEGQENSIQFKVQEELDGRIELSISDNGTGLPKDFDIKGSEGLGFEIVSKLCRQINAGFTFETNQYGTTFLIVFRPRK